MNKYPRYCADESLLVSFHLLLSECRRRLVGEENSAAYKDYTQAREYLSKNGGSTNINELEKGNLITNVQITDAYIEGGASFTDNVTSFTFNDKNKDGKFQPDEKITGAVRSDPKVNGTILWNPSNMMVDAQGNKHSPALIFDHEVTHALHALKDLLKYLKDVNTNTIDGTDNEEEQITINEINKVSRKLNNGDGGYGKRTDHGALSIEPNKGGVTSNIVLFNMVLQTAEIYWERIQQMQKSDNTTNKQKTNGNGTGF